MSRIELKNLGMKYDAHNALKGLDLTVEQGEMLALVGPSGSGKTTALKLIAALLEPTEGEILFDGVAVTGLPTQRRGAVVVFQENALFPHLTAEENIGFGLKVRGMHTAERRKRAESLLELVQLQGMGARYPRELSGGQQQRVAIARALAVEPRVLLLDEPFSSLDASLKNAMREFVHQLQRHLGITCLFVTHDIQDALMTADRIAVLFEGMLEQTGSPRDIYRRPASRRIADFFGAASYERVHLSGGRGRSAFGTFQADTAYDGPADFLLRPEAIALCEPGTGTVPGIVTDAAFCGAQTRYRVRTATADIQVVAADGRAWHVGEPVSLNLAQQDGSFFDIESGVRL